MDMPATVTKTRLWTRSLADQGKEDPLFGPRERLRTSFFRFRERVALLAAEIHRQLPELTVHDITHLDALWEMGDTVVGDPIFLNPAEAFVFGGAILLHDLGMALAAYPGGLEELKRDALWSDAVVREFQKTEGRSPTQDEISNPPEQIRCWVVASLLRGLHAKRAEQLPNISLGEKDRDPQYLIEDTEIRQVFGRTIGLIAHSHWWPINKVETEFVRPLGSPHWCPTEWQVDCLKIACLLRVSDASHLDARRAPSFLRSLRRPTGHSADHWKFQEKLQKPYLTDDALAYSSGYAFPLEDASAWWLCLDTLANVDKELRQVDTLLAEKHLQRLAARRVAGIESPERLVHYIPTELWSPIDAFVHVSDVPHLVKTLGGQELYGNDKKVALRELIQNGADAIRARRLSEDRAPDWGSLIIRQGNDATGDWIEVEDSGVGMSKEVLTRYLLDFGSSYWGSTLMLEEFPGLLSKGFQATGKYGIGFFSVFMLGNAVQVRTRKSSAAQNETQVLEFNTGLSAKPILRPALENERIRDGGTSIRVWCEKPLVEGLFRRYGNFPPYTLKEFCEEICPSMDVSVSCGDADKIEMILPAFDWTTCPPEKIIQKGGGFERADNYTVEAAAFAKNAAVKLIRDLREEDGTLVGRACVLDTQTYMWQTENRYPEIAGSITVGGLHATDLAGIGGIIIGKPERAARDSATPIVSREVLQRWATEQATIVGKLIDVPEVAAGCAEIIWRCGGDTGSLPICKFRGDWLSYDMLSKYPDLPDELFLLSPFSVSDYTQIKDFVLSDAVIITECMGVTTIARSSGYINWPDRLTRPEYEKSEFRGCLAGAVVSALATAWNVDLAKILSTDRKHIHRMQTIGRTSNSDIKNNVLIIRRSDG